MGSGAGRWGGVMLVSDLTHVLGDLRRSGVLVRDLAWGRAALSTKLHHIINLPPWVSLL